MEDIRRQEFVDEIKKYEVARDKTTSPYLKRDYEKKIKRMQAELKQYDLWHRSVG